MNFKRLNIISTFILVTGLLACEPPITFDEPQPADTDNISKFPGRLQGQYLSLKDSSILIIGEKLIQSIYDYDIKWHVNQLDSNYKVSGDTVYDMQGNEFKIFYRMGDTLIDHIHSVDTLFQMDYDNVVRKFKGYFFLNTRYDKTNWIVRKIQLTSGQLVISSISVNADIDNLRAITESPADTVTTNRFSATKKQFKEFIKREGFSDSEVFVKLRNN